ncbi:hypothetical protein ACJMK2_024950 [Sinanodonta woodiana]|uniref:Uncharacterized protein n=1 Tax=Sinanodonta woodiana TaxID=1069815 RepID=A0ABD3XF18_SINWO
MSSIKIEMINPSPLAVVIYDVEEQRCTQVGDLYLNRIKSCAFNASNFTFTLHNVSWLDKGTYVAWDDRRFLLDSIDLDIQVGSKLSIPETSNVYITLPSTATEPADSWKVVQGRDLDRTTHTQPDNANVFFDNDHTEGNMRLEINLFGYSVKLRLTNLMMNDQLIGQHDEESDRINDTGQIQVILKDKYSLSFQLLNASFEGIKELEKSCDKRNAIINVTRSRFVQKGENSGKPSCLYNETDISSNTNNKVQTYVTSLVISSNVTNESLTDVMQSYRARIRDCVFSGNNVSFTFQESPWLENATFAACDDNGFILQSIFIEVQISNEDHTLSSGPSYTHGPSSSNDKQTLILVSAIVVVVVAACLAVIAFWMIRHRKVSTNETERKSTANSSGNLDRNANEFIPPETTRIAIVTNDNAVNLTDAIKGQVNIRRKEENIIYRRFDCTDSSNRTAHNVQINSRAHLYDYISENHDHCWPWESNLLLRPHSTESVAEQRVEYDYVVQHSFMTLRPPAPDPVVNRKSKFGGTSDHGLLWYKGINLKSASRLDKSSEQESCHSINELAPSSYFELECIRATGTMNSPSWLINGVDQKLRNVENSNSFNFLPKPEFVELRDKSKHEQVAQVLQYDLPQFNVDPASMDRRHRKSQSLNDMMAIQSIRWSRRRTARCCTKSDCYDSL